ncbi:MAG: putative toxin-antitoxin system toxin component, PIN family [Candidatus Altiarchaeota archaeon]
MLKFFIDANTLVSGLLFPGLESQLLEAGRLSLCQLHTNRYVLSEVEKTLHKPLFKLESQELEELIAILHDLLVIHPNPSKKEIKKHNHLLNDKKDLPVLIGAQKAYCDFLVTGDKELQKIEQIKTLSTRQGLKKLRLL